MKTDLPVKVFEIRKRQGGIPERRCSLDQFLDGGSSESQGVIAFHMERDEHERDFLT
jgi:hypothetical protein